MDRFLTEPEGATLDRITGQVTAADTFEVAFETNDAIAACLNGGPTKDQALLVLGILVSMLNAGKLSRPGIEAVRPIVHKLETLGVS